MSRFEEVPCSRNILVPITPGCNGKIAARIAAAIQVNLQDGITSIGEGSRLQGYHAPGFIHFLGKRMDI